MAMVVGKISLEEMERLHGKPFDGIPSVVEHKVATEPPSATGVMVMIDTGQGRAFFGYDFEQWSEPDGPTLREAQAFRATRMANRLYLQATSGAIFGGLTEEDRDAVVQRLLQKGMISMHVIDVPAAAFA